MANDGNPQQQQPVVLPSQVAQQPAASSSPATGTPAHQQDLPDDQDTSDFVMEAYDAVVGNTVVDPQGHIPLHQRGQEPPVQGGQQAAAGDQQQQQVGQQPPVAEPEFRLFPDSPRGEPAVLPAETAQQPGQQQAPQQAQVPGAPQPQPQPGVQPQPPAAVPGQQPAAGQQPPAAAPQQPQDPFEFAAQQIAAQEVQFTKALADQAYKIPTEDFEKFIGGDSNQASMLAARVHVNVMASVMKVLAQQMPVVMNRLLSVHEINRVAEDTFWGTNRFLDRTNQQHRQVVDMATRAVRQANPQADTATVTKMAGLMAAMQLGIDPTAAMTRVQGQVQGRPVIQTPGRVVRQAPPANQPIAPSGVPGNNGAMPANQWDVMSRIMEADDSGAFESR